MKNLLANWKTTSTGLLMIGGSAIHLIYAIAAHTANETTWTITLGAVIGGVGLMFAGDAGAPPPPPKTPPTP